MNEPFNQDTPCLLLCPNCKWRIPFIEIKEYHGKVYVFVNCICASHLQKYLIKEFIILLSTAKYPQYKCTKHRTEGGKYCCNCSIWLCSTCISDHNQHMTSHCILPYKLDLACTLHRLNYSHYCLLCRKNLCLNCKSKHLNHQLTELSLVSVGKLKQMHLTTMDNNQKTMTAFNNIDYDDMYTLIQKEVLALYETHLEIHKGISKLIDCLDYTIQMCNGNMLYQLTFNYNIIESLVNIKTKLGYSDSETKINLLFQLKRMLYMEFRKESNYKWIGSLTGHTDEIIQILELKNGQLATISKDNTIKVWTKLTYHCIGTLIGHTSLILSILELSDGQLATTSEDCTIKIWNLSTYQCSATLNSQILFCFIHYNYSLLETQYGQLISRDKNIIEYWDTKTYKKNFTLQSTKEIASVFNVKDNDYIILQFKDNSFELWNNVLYQCIDKVDETSINNNIYFELKNKLVARISTSEDSNSIFLFKATFKQCDDSKFEKIKPYVNKTNNDLDVLSLYFNKLDKKLVYFPLILSGTLIGHTSWILKVMSLSNGQIASYSGDNNIKIWNAETCNCNATLLHLGGIYDIFEDFKGQLISYANEGIQLWNMTTYQCICFIKAYEDWNQDQFANVIELNSKHLLVYDCQSNTQLWNKYTYECFEIKKYHQADVLKDGQVVVLKSLDTFDMDIWKIN